MYRVLGLIRRTLHHEQTDKTMKQFFEGKSLEELYKALDNFKIYLSIIADIKDPAELFDKIESFWKKEIGFFIFLTAPTTELKTSQSYFRIRIDTGDINSQLIQEFGTPPVKATTAFQRANIPNFPVMYCGASIDVAAFESLHKPEFIDKNFYLSKWAITKNISTATTHFLFKESIKSDLSENAKNIQEHTNRVYDTLTAGESLTPEQKKFINSYVTFIVSEFLNETNYVLSSYIGHSVLYANHNMRSSIIYYPSIKKKHFGFNAAINPNFASQYLKLEKIYYCKVLKIDVEKENIEISFSKIGIPSHSQIIWNNLSALDFQDIKNDYEG